MRLNNSDLIEQALSTTAPEVEPLYWVVEDSLYGGKIGRAMGVLEILLYIARYNPRVVQEGLQKDHRRRLKEICHEMLGSCGLREYQPIIMRKAASPRPIPFSCEAELKQYIIKKPHILSDALRDNIKITGSEIETDCGYKCDLVAESSNNFYPVELKIDQGDHAVVSQCSKYCYYFYRKLRYDRFKHLQGVVIARGFDDWSINELRKQGHWIFSLAPQGSEDVFLEPIT